MPKYTIYIDVHDENVPLPHKAGKMGFDISAVKYGRSRRLVCSENWDHLPYSEEICRLDEIEKNLNVTVKRDQETGEPLEGMEFDVACPVIVAQLKQWLPNESQEISNYYKSSKYEWKHFDDIDGLIQRIKGGQRIIGPRFAESLTEIFDKLCATKELSDVQEEEELWKVAQRVEESKLWEKAEELAITNPQHPFASIRRAKELTIKNMRFVLTVSFLKKTINDRVLVLFKAYSLTRENLPAGLKLLPLDEDGHPGKDENDEIYQITAFGERDEISLPLSCDRGERLILTISLGESKLYEYFVV